MQRYQPYHTLSVHTVYCVAVNIAERAVAFEYTEDSVRVTETKRQAFCSVCDRETPLTPEQSLIHLGKESVFSYLRQNSLDRSQTVPERGIHYNLRKNCVQLQNVQEALGKQGQLLGQHHQALEGISSSIGNLNQQQSQQQAQLEQISASLQNLTALLAPQQAPARVEPEPAAPSLPTAGSFSVNKPGIYDGAPNLCRGFLLQCSIYFSTSPPSSDQSRIAFVISCLSGRALDWATAEWDNIKDGTYENFIKEFQAVFDHPNAGRAAADLLMQLQQGTRSVADYALEFRTVAAGSGWNETALLTAFRNGLNTDIRKELACRDDGLSLKAYISLAIHFDQLKHGGTSVTRRSIAARTPALPPSVSPWPRQTPASRTPSELSAEEPMQLGGSRLSSEERLRRLRGGLCMYCGNSGHIIRNCEARPTRPPPASTRRGGVPAEAALREGRLELLALCASMTPSAAGP
ncbi:hypothetical protein NFI96_032131 [Prochilodus magdalenae]|nr:hypothetical protein NFI96_032131 [Prochilodus magdalenae]